MPDASWPFAEPIPSDRALDILCAGHAIVDRLVDADLAAVRAAGLVPGAMTLVDAEQATKIGQSLRGWQVVAGGSAANTAVGVASLGGRPGFVGAVGDDDPGRWYGSDLEAAGVRATVASVTSGSPTAVCHILVAEGGDRSMATHLGAAGELAVATVDAARPAEAAVVYVEGYLFDAPPAADALRRLVELAKDASCLLSVSLSDPFVVERHGHELRDLVLGGAVDVLFGNEDEALALTGAADRESAASALRRPGLAAIVTLGAEGAMLVLPEGDVLVEADEVASVLDTTGAGDLFAAGCLYGLTRHYGPEVALRLGSRAAAEIITHFGARPLVSLAEATEDLLGI